MRRTEWVDPEGENAFVVMGNISRLLKDLGRQTGRAAPGGRDLHEVYREEAMAGDYEHLLDVSHSYAFEYLRDTLNVPEER